MSQVLGEEGRPMRAEAFKLLIDELLDEVLGFGPLEPLLADPTINDILVNSTAASTSNASACWRRARSASATNATCLRIIDKIVSRIGRRVDEVQPWVDARLEDGSRVNAIIRPCAIDGPSLSIRKFSRNPLTLERMIEMGTLTEQPRPSCVRSLAGAAQCPDLGRHRVGQDDDAECHVVASSVSANGS